jgi:hypothetical protein
MATILNATIERGCTFNLAVVYETAAGVAVDVTGYTAALKVRQSLGSADVLLSLTSSSGIVVGTSDGLFTAVLSAPATAALTWASGIYDFLITSPGGTVTKIAKGNLTVEQSVTRA